MILKVIFFLGCFAVVGGFGGSGFGRMWGVEVRGFWVDVVNGI